MEIKASNKPKILTSESFSLNARNETNVDKPAIAILFNGKINDAS